MPAGRPPIYDPEFHPEEIIRVMRDEGKTTVEVACDWDITTRVINLWAKEHPEFLLAYARAQEYRKAWWLKRGRDGLLTYGDEKFDSRLFSLMMKYDGINLDERIVKLPALAECKTFAEQSTVICGALASGKITIKEAQGYVDVIATMAKIDEVTELRRMLEEIEKVTKSGR